MEQIEIQEYLNFNFDCEKCKKRGVEKCLWTDSHIGKMEIRQKDIYQWTHQHPKGVIMIYKNFTTEYNLFENLIFDNQYLRVIEPK